MEFFDSKKNWGESEVKVGAFTSCINLIEKLHCCGSVLFFPCTLRPSLHMFLSVKILRNEIQCYLIPTFQDLKYYSLRLFSPWKLDWTLHKNYCYENPMFLKIVFLGYQVGHGDRMN